MTLAYAGRNVFFGSTGMFNTTHPEMKILNRIQKALQAAAHTILQFAPGDINAEFKPGGRGPVSDADGASNQTLRDVLLQDGEAWLSEESADDFDRLKSKRVWIVDPLDGTLEFISGIPEWCVSVALVEDGRAVAGGICNPATGELILGSLGTGLTYNGVFTYPTMKKSLAGAIVGASRSEVRREEWKRFENSSFLIRPLGSVAYKLALVAAGRLDATWTLTPKNEWDVAAGVALIESAGGCVRGLTNKTLVFNNRNTLIPGLIASGRYLQDELWSSLSVHLRPSPAELVEPPA